ncbi:MAG: hypothetical protein CL476_11130 [Acidobacteria bacterium]|nr:hypothetical protein [Acidobacteriota bacterium]
MRIHDGLIGWLIALGGGGVILGASGLPTLAGQPYGPALFPTLLGVGLVVCGVSLGLTGRRQGLQRRWVDLASWTRSPGRRRRVILVPFTIAAYAAMAPTVGFYLTMTAVLIVLMTALGRRRLETVVIALATAGAIQVLFGGLLRVPLPPGILLPGF